MNQDRVATKCSPRSSGWRWCWGHDQKNKFKLLNTTKWPNIRWKNTKNIQKQYQHPNQHLQKTGRNTKKTLGLKNLDHCYRTIPPPRFRMYTKWPSCSASSLTIQGYEGRWFGRGEGGWSFTSTAPLVGVVFWGLVEGRGFLNGEVYIYV